jgi:hypothetical protein
MSIAVIDQGPELYWFVSNALSQTDISLKHIQTLGAGEHFILQELPDIVIMNGDDKTLRPEEFINKMRNHVFARNTLFIVFTSDTSVEFKKSLLVAGAGQILYRGRGFSPSPKFFASLIKWFLTKKDPDPQTIDFKPAPFPTEADFISFGRIGWMNSTHMMVETNINLEPGQSLEFKSSLFEELDIKNLKLECVEKNKVGRYYQYANSVLCKIHTKDFFKDSKKLEAWIANNQDISKHKPVKIVYFEAESDYRDEIRKMVKADKRYCARGYASIKNVEEILQYQLPHLILINRALIQKDKARFDVIKNFVKNNFCYCITYANSDVFNAEEFKKDYDFAMHSPTSIDLSLLESMILKLEEKLPDNLKTDPKKIYFNKYSPYSRISFLATCKLKEIALSGAGVILPFSLSNFCACEIGSNPFSVANMNRHQFFRSFSCKKVDDGFYHRMVFMGQNVKDNEQVRETIRLIEADGYEKWLAGEVEPA